MRVAFFAVVVVLALLAVQGAAWGDSVALASISWVDSGGGESDTAALTSIRIPEPTTLALLGLGVAGLAWLRRRSTGKHTEY